MGLSIHRVSLKPSPELENHEVRNLMVLVIKLGEYHSG
jgi:hypothetical protein